MSARWRVLSASTGGGAHARAGLSSQDAFAVQEAGGALVMAVADGAGTAPLAAAGASLAVTLAVREMARRLDAGRPDDAGGWRRLVHDGPDRVLRQFQRTAVALTHGGNGFRAGDAGTTLTVVVACRPWLAVFAVGDGFVVTRTADGNLDLLLAPPPETGYPVGATTLLTSPDPGMTARRLVAWLPDLTGIVAGSDGMDTMVLKYEGTRPIRPFADPIGQLLGLADHPDTDPMALSRLLTSEQVCDLTQDDRTLVLAVPR